MKVFSKYGSRLSCLRRFSNDRSGAVTADWMVITALLIGLGVSVTVAIEPELDELSFRTLVAVAEFVQGQLGLI